MKNFVSGSAIKKKKNHMFVLDSASAYLRHIYVVDQMELVKYHYGATASV